jgi:hypothetical protein
MTSCGNKEAEALEVASGARKPAMSDSQTAADDAWQRHVFLDGLYRFYLDLIIKFHSLYLPVVGAVAAYVLDKLTLLSSAGALAIPFILSSGVAIILFFAINEAEELVAAIQTSASGLHLIATHAKILVRAVIAFCVLHVVLALALGLLIGVIIVRSLHST